VTIAEDGGFQVCISNLDGFNSRMKVADGALPVLWEVMDYIDKDFSRLVHNRLPRLIHDPL
jgi:hypothetical protein